MASIDHIRHFNRRSAMVLEYGCQLLARRRNVNRRQLRRGNEACQRVGICTHDIETAQLAFKGHRSGSAKRIQQGRATRYEFGTAEKKLGNLCEKLCRIRMDEMRSTPLRYCRHKLAEINLYGLSAR